jgi:galactose-1-phosphate uridylyltransferase
LRDTLPDPLVFQTNAAKHKPENIRHTLNACPFCEPARLTHVLAQQADMIWLVNKFRTLQDTLQTLIVESADHNGDISNYTLTKNRQLFAFAFQCWHQLQADSRFQSVVMYKNFGPLSGGSLRHPHLQIVGFKHTDGYTDISLAHFQGLLVGETDALAVTISTKPVMGFVEINVHLKQATALNALADTVQAVITYVLQRHYHGQCDSYNLFFYQFNGEVYCKVLPRFVVSPYFVGYHLTQVNDHDQLIAVQQGLQTIFAERGLCQ